MSIRLPKGPRIRTLKLGRTAAGFTFRIHFEMGKSKSPVVRVDGDRIVDWTTFYEVFSESFGLPEFFGRNMDAWIDCLTRLGDPASGMTKVHAEPGEVVTLVVDNVNRFAARCPDQYDALVECAAFVNWRLVEKGGRAVLALAFNRWAEWP